MDSPPLPERQKNDYSHTNYYHSQLKSIDEVKTLMISYLGKDGAFLIRNSFSKPGCLTVSVMHDNGIKHFNLAQTGTEYYVQDVKFPSIGDLVQFYRNNDVPNQEGIKHVRLMFPIVNQQNIVRKKSASMFTNSTMLGHSGSSGTMSTASTNSPALGRSFSTLPLNRQGSMSSISSSACGSDVSRRHTTGTVESAHIPLPTAKSNPNQTCGQTSPKHRKSLIGKLFHKSKKRINSDETQTLPEKDESEVSERYRTASESSTSDKINIRPPLPLPDIPSDRQNSYSNDIPQYDHVRDVSFDNAPNLIETLKRTDTYSASEEKCECGLTFEESELPRGWSMHISHEQATFRRLFFMGPDQETAWNLPLDVSLELSPEQQDRIKDLYSGTHLAQLRDPATSGAVGVSLQPASMPSSPPVNPGSQAQSFQQARRSPVEEESDGGTSSLHQPQSNHRQPTQHNETTGSTGSSGGVSSAIMMNGRMSLNR